MTKEELLKENQNLKETNEKLIAKLQEAAVILQQSQLQERQFELSRITLVTQVFNALISNNYLDDTFLKACSNDILKNLIRSSDTKSED